MLDPCDGSAEEREPTVKMSTVAGAAVATTCVLIAAVGAFRAIGRHVRAGPEAPTAVPSAAPSAAPAAPPGAPTRSSPAAHQGFLYGRVTSVGGETYEGRLRFGDGEEAFWNDTFNGVKSDNTWAELVPKERLPKEYDTFELLGVELFSHERPVNLRRQLMVRMGDIVRIDSRGDDVQVTLRSGSVAHLDRMDASDFDDGVHVWDRTRGEVDLDSLQVRSLEFLATPPLDGVPARLYGTVRAAHGTFTGFVQWNRDKCLDTDVLLGRTAQGERRLTFDAIRSIVRRDPRTSVVTLSDGSEVVLSGTHDTGRDHRGVVVDDPRYGRVIVSWRVFERVDFAPAGSGPAYGEFAAGQPLAGTVTTHTGERLSGRIVYDLDESESIETLDAPAFGVDYTIPFARIASIVPRDQDALVTLVTGEELVLERTGDLGPKNGGLLVFADRRDRPDYVPWGAVARIEVAIRGPEVHAGARTGARSHDDRRGEERSGGEAIRRLDGQAPEGDRAPAAPAR